MWDRRKPRLAGLLGLAVAAALCGASATASAAKKPPAPKAPAPSAPLVHFIHCATEAGGGPCGLDPAMQRLNGDPLFAKPQPARPFDDFDRLYSAPSR